MTSDPQDNQMKVTIFNKEYRILCPEGQEQQLMEAAELLNRRITESTQTGAGSGNDQAAAITALNLTHELLEFRRQQQRQQQMQQREQDQIRQQWQSEADEIHSRLQALNDRLAAKHTNTNCREKPGQLHQF